MALPTLDDIRRVSEQSDVDDHLPLPAAPGDGGDPAADPDAAKVALYEN